MYRFLLGEFKIKGVSLIMALAFFLVWGGVTASEAYAKEPARPEISLQEAIDLSLEHSNSVDKAYKEMERTEMLSQDAGDNVNFIPTGHTGIPEVSAAYSNALSSQLNWQLSRKAYTAAQEAQIMDTTKKYWDILAGEEKIRNAKTDVKNALLQLQYANAAKRVGVSLSVGLSPDQALIAADYQYTGAQGALASYQNDLDKGYAAFNQLVGLYPDDRPVLTDTIVFEPLKVTDLNHEVSRVLETAPSIWQAEETANLRAIIKNISAYNSYFNAEAEDIELEQADLDTSSAKKLLEQTTRTLYYGIKSLEESYASAEKQVQVCEENLRVKQLQYELGMVTSLELASEEKKLADAQLNLLNIAYNHAQLKLSFQTPWAG
jgi:outer membrane protein